MRDLDEPIPPTEELYRSVAYGESDEEALLPTSITLPATSVSRAKYLARPEDAIKDTDTGLAVTTSSKVPASLDSPGGTTFEITANDDPSQGDAHAEIRVHRKGRAYDPRYKVESKSFRLELKAAIAASFTMVLKPTAPESPAE